MKEIIGRSAAPRNIVRDKVWEDGEALIAEMTNQPKDRNVLAAAVHGGCDLLVTANLRDFPDSSTRPYGIGAIHPDAFLSELWHAHRDKALAAIRCEVASCNTPPLTIAAFARNLTPVTPGFAHLPTATTPTGRSLPRAVSGPRVSGPGRTSRPNPAPPPRPTGRRSP